LFQVKVKRLKNREQALKSNRKVKQLCCLEYPLLVMSGIKSAQILLWALVLMMARCSRCYRLCCDQQSRTTRPVRCWVLRT